LNHDEGDSIQEGSIVVDTLDILDRLTTKVGKIGSFATKAFKAIKGTLFGILPLIRSILYLKYKRKADTILSLEEQMHFISLNIEHLQNIKGMDPVKKETIIRSQQATIEGFRKRVAKLRVELMDSEKEAAIALDDSKGDITNTDDGLVLEGGNG
jgi:hypothetical protein